MKVEETQEPPEVDAETGIGIRPNTIREGGARHWIHATKIDGRFQRLRVVSTVCLLVAFYASPWLKVGENPFLKLSFLETSFYLFGEPILVYEFYHFVLLALLLVVTLFLASALFGRIWCGYACPQTVFIEQILGRIETLCEGPATKRIAMKNKPLTVERAARKVLKHALYVLVSASFAFTLVALFTGPELILSGNSSGVWMALAVLTGIAWFDGGYWREQFCHIACPYARFQSVMQDEQTRTIGYDKWRGEPRGKKAAGDCIDCGLCVRVCPSGIDIRQGPAQLECTGCARCVDACDSIMTSLHRKRGLIRYDAVQTFVANLSARSVLRPRVFLYGGLWLGLFTVGVYQFVYRSNFHAKMLSVHGAMPYFLEGNILKNLSTLKIGNQFRVEDSFDIRVVGESAFKIESPLSLGPIKPGAEATLPLLLSAEQTEVGKWIEVEIKSRATQETKKVRRKFVGPDSP